MALEFDTSPYVASHGKEPRGRGSWAFGTTRNPDVCDADECWFSPGGMSYAEAKKWAKARALNNYGATSGTLYVQP